MTRSANQVLSGRVATTDCSRGFQATVRLWIQTVRPESIHGLKPMAIVADSLREKMAARTKADLRPMMSPVLEGVCVQINDVSAMIEIYHVAALPSLKASDTGPAFGPVKAPARP